MSDVPETVWSGSFNLFGVEVKCHTLNNGQRIIEAESLENLIAAMGGDATLSMAQFDGFSKWRAGQ